MRSTGAPPSLMINQPNPNESVMPIRGVEEIPKPPVVNRREILHTYLISLTYQWPFHWSIYEQQHSNKF
jgi:hypothetical protein